MVTAVASSTSSTATAAFNGRKLDRCQDGTLWATFTNGSAQTEFHYSKDNGVTWTSASFIANTTPGVGSLFIDLDDYAHFVYKDTTSNYLMYRRGTPNVGRTAWTWSAAVELSTNTALDFPDVTAGRNAVTGGWDAFIVTSLASASENRALYKRFPISSAGVIGAGVIDGLTALVTMGVLGGSYYASGGAIHTYPSIDFNHTGDGKTVAGGTPHLYVGWTAGARGVGKGVRFRKAVYSGGAWTWNAEREIDNTLGDTSAGQWLQCMFDGTRAVLVGELFNQASGFRNFIYDRDAADTTTTAAYLEPSYGTNDVNDGAASYDSLGNIYQFGAPGNASLSPQVLQWRKWTRSGATMGNFATIDAAGPARPYVSAKRGSQPGNSIEILYTDGTSSPYTVQYDRTVPDVDAPTTPYTPMIML